eukprot:26169-Eustigmatos_ZCMA.PRE.1
MMPRCLAAVSLQAATRSGTQASVSWYSGWVAEVHKSGEDTRMFIERTAGQMIDSCQRTKIVAATSSSASSIYGQHSME